MVLAVYHQYDCIRHIVQSECCISVDTGTLSHQHGSILKVVLHQRAQLQLTHSYYSPAQLYSSAHINVAPGIFSSILSS